MWLNNVTITGGSADNGGGIANLGGTVTLNFSTVTRNTATDAGGGIASATLGPPGVAKLTLNFSRVTDNRQTAGPASQNSLGGGGILSIWARSPSTPARSAGTPRWALSGAGSPAAITSAPPPIQQYLTLNLSQVTGNTAPNAGGGGIQNLLGTATINSAR